MCECATHIVVFASTPIGLWVNFSEENKFVTGLNEIIFMLQPMDILDYIDKHAPNAKEEIKKGFNIHQMTRILYY